MEITEEIIKETTKCTANFECLKNENYVCRNNIVESNINNKYLFIDCKKEKCNYKIPFANGVVCSCPVRIEIEVINMQ